MSRYDELTPADYRSLLGQIRADLDAAADRRRFAMDRLSSLIGGAKECLPMTEIAELTGLTRPTLYKLLED